MLKFSKEEVHTGDVFTEKVFSSKTAQSGPWRIYRVEDAQHAEVAQQYFSLKPDPAMYRKPIFFITLNGKEVKGANGFTQAFWSLSAAKSYACQRTQEILGGM